MKAYTNSDPVFSDTIYVVETTDPAHANNINEATEQLQDNILALKYTVDSNAAVVLEITIPESGWSKLTSSVGSYLYYVDVYEETVKEEQIPVVAIAKESQAAALTCGLCPTAETSDGAIRFFAQSEPTESMKATCVMVNGGGSGGSTGGGGSGGSGGDSYVLPAATTSKLGGIKVGNYLTVAQDGTLSVNKDQLSGEISSDDDEFKEMLDEAFK